MDLGGCVCHLSVGVLPLDSFAVGVGMVESRPDRPKASYAPDGVLAADWRLVRPGGRVKCFGTWWQSEKLLPYVGKWVWVQAGEYWIVWVSVFQEAFSGWICNIGDGK